jgi:hypothetical protein
LVAAGFAAGFAALAGDFAPEVAFAFGDAIDFVAAFEALAAGLAVFTAGAFAAAGLEPLAGADFAAGFAVTLVFAVGLAADGFTAVLTATFAALLAGVLADDFGAELLDGAALLTTLVTAFGAGLELAALGAGLVALGAALLLGTAWLDFDLADCLPEKTRARIPLAPFGLSGLLATLASQSSGKRGGCHESGQYKDPCQIRLSTTEWVLINYAIWRGHSCRFDTIS